MTILCEPGLITDRLGAKSEYPLFFPVAHICTYAPDQGSAFI
jgi:hypothetical protein